MAAEPQDHKKSKKEIAEEAQLRFDEIDGHELLVPFSKVKGSDQLRLLGRLKTLGVVDENEDGSDVDFDSLDLEMLADLIDYVAEKFAVDKGEFEAFTSGARGFEKAMNLAIAYAGELGNADA